MREELPKSPGTMSTSKPIEEPRGVLKSGFVTAIVVPAVSVWNKGRKLYFAVLGERSLELYASEKAFRNRKQAKFLFDLAFAFNVSKDHHEPKLKRCVCLMMPDETAYLKGETELSTSEWFEGIISSAIPARACKFGRPVMPFEFFENAWDVEVVAAPKLKKPYRNEDNLPNMCMKQDDLLGPRRLCFYAHTIILCKKRIETGKAHEIPESGIPPFKPKDFLELERQFVANFGNTERYFFMQMGRGSPMGACDIWMCCENDEVAKDIHEKLHLIIVRESEKKKKMGNGFSPLIPPNLLLRAQQAHGHRERSHTQPIRPRTSTVSQPGDSSPSAPGSASASARERRARLRDCKALIDSFEEENQRSLHNRESRPSHPHISTLHQASFNLDLTRRVGSPASFSGAIGPSTRKPSAGTPNQLCSSAFNLPPPPPPPITHNQRLGSVGTGSPLPFSFHSTPTPAQQQRRQSQTIKEEKPIPRNIYQSMGLGGDIEWAKKRLSPSTSATEETEDSGGTLRMETNSLREADTISCNSRRSLAVDVNIIERRRGSKDVSSSEESDELLSLGGAGSSTGPGSTSTQEEYAQMDAVDWLLGDGSGHLHVPPRELQYQLEEVRSYVSDSSDSCYSSMTNKMNGESAVPKKLPPISAPVQNPGPGGNPPRAYSFGARTTKPELSASGTGAADSGNSLSDSKESNPIARVPAGGLMPPPEDPRKRAFSLGSKSFFQRPFRKLSQHAQARQARHSQTSASGASLASSSNASSLGPPSSSSTNHISTLGGDDAYGRNRSGSFGSGRSTPYNRRGGSVSAQGSDKLGAASRDHLVEIDFGGLGRSGSGSMASVDSPCSFRSRTSSFGCKEYTTSGGLSILANEEERPPVKPPSQIFLEEVTRQIAEAGLIPQGISVEGDYVLTTAVDIAALKAQAAAAEEVGQSCYLGASLSPPDPKLLDIRQSQHFETIQENISGRSSRCSSRNSNHINEADEDEYTLMELNSHLTADVFTASARLDKEEKLETVPEVAAPVDYSDYTEMIVCSALNEIDTIEETPEPEENKSEEHEEILKQIEKINLESLPTFSKPQDPIEPLKIPSIAKRNSVPSLRTNELSIEDHIQYTVLETSGSPRREHNLHPSKTGRIRSKSGVSPRTTVHHYSPKPTFRRTIDDYTVMKN